METISVDDETLVARIAHEDEEALAVLYERHQASLVAYLALFTRDRGVIDEAIQDAMLGIWKGASRFSGRSTARSWMFAIARRRLLDLLRRKRLPASTDDALMNHPDPGPTPERVAMENAAEAEMLAAIRRLSRVHQEVLILTFAHDLSYEELASVLDVPLGTIKSRLSNARKALRQQLGTKTP
ncbi:MAG TPA: sigma-70 family RNA polymerase sigma factor [Thermomicrobiales bacterium]|nr:sigma-70 family RNA polymerase sigma factor [Thermomicrobiales bacterium]